MYDQLYLYIEFANNSGPLLFEDQEEIDVENMDEKMAEKIVKIITNESALPIKKIQCSKIGADIEFENCCGIKILYRLSIRKMMPISEVELNHISANSVR